MKLIIQLMMVIHLIKRSKERLVINILKTKYNYFYGYMMI